MVATLLFFFPNVCSLKKNCSLGNLKAMSLYDVKDFIKDLWLDMDFILPPFLSFPICLSQCSQPEILSFQFLSQDSV